MYLAALGYFELLRTLFQEIAIPTAVFQEVVVAGARYPVSREVVTAQGKWIHVQSVKGGPELEGFRQAGLDPGESEALVLAQELNSEGLLLDDSDAVRIASGMSLNVIRTPGIFRLAKQRGLILTVAPKLDALRSAGFWLRDDHYRIILQSAGEL